MPIIAEVARERGSDPGANSLSPEAITVTVNPTLDITWLGRATINKLMNGSVLEWVAMGGRTLVPSQASRKARPFSRLSA